MAYINNKFCWHGVISTDTAKAEVTRMCEALLANTVIERYDVELI